MATLKLKPETTSARLTQIRKSIGGTPSCDDWREEAKATLQNLGRMFPAVFDPKDRKPLALSIHEGLIQETDYSSVTIKSALRWWTGHGGYLEAVAGGTHRHDLQGNQVAQIKEGHKLHARKKLDERKERRMAAAEKPKPKPALAKTQKPKPTQYRLNQLADKFNGDRHAA